MCVLHSSCFAVGSCDSLEPTTVCLRQNVHVTLVLLTLGCDSSSLSMLLHDFTSPANGPVPRSSPTMNNDAEVHQ
jgi:hypothetical protein